MIKIINKNKCNNRYLLNKFLGLHFKNYNNVISKPNNYKTIYNLATLILSYILLFETTPTINKKRLIDNS